MRRIGGVDIVRVAGILKGWGGREEPGGDSAEYGVGNVIL